MRKVLIILCLILSFLGAEETLRVSEFDVTVFSKLKNDMVNVEASLVFEGRDVKEYDFKIIDTLNVVIGSFYAEDLVMSKGKEAFKTALMNYAKNKYQIDIDSVYILKLNVLETPTADIIIKRLEKEGYIKR